MPDIRYICVSDLHLGADNSLLTNLGSQIGEVDPHQPSEVLVGLANCLREFVRHNKGPVKPTLILNGDLLELALTQDNVALMAFERFIELMFPTNGDQLIDAKIIFIPGNHDHHLWETARETQYVEFLQGRRSKKPPGDLPSPWHTTKMLTPDLVDSCLLNAVIRRHAHLTQRGVHVGTAYPNLGLLNDDESKCVIFSHGHFVESIYTLMTTMGDFVFPGRKAPEQIWGIETENFAWIDFFWSAMGRSGEVGKDIERTYDMLLVPDARRRLIRQLVCAGGQHWFRRWPKLGERLALLFVPFISKALKRVGVFEKTQVDSVLTQDARQGLKAYIEGPLAKQILAEYRRPMQAQTTFVFGHTHKPFFASLNFANFSHAVSVCNSGGWVVDTMNTEPIHGGAIVLADEGLNVVSVRMYNEGEKQRRWPVKVEALDRSENPLYDHVTDLIKVDQDPWLSFSRVVAENVDMYHKRFRDRLNLVK
jgi:UDP-2,3-diacylglucosamine pyrophosphatase LpxH